MYQNAELRPVRSRRGAVPDRPAPRLPVIPDLSAAEFAAAKGVSIRTVRNWIAAGYVRATRVGPRLVRIPASELDRIGTPIEVA
jgi:excisionase family DNA binding protein